MGRILLVDDDGDMVKITAHWIERAGHEVSFALSGEEALEMLKGADKDLIILDYAMPGMNGPEVFEAIRSDPGLKDIPVIFRTGKEDGSVEEIRERLKPDGIVLKSEGKGSLLSAVSVILPG